MADGMMRALLTLSIALYSAAVTAEDLPDPTRPPASIAAPVTANGQGPTWNRSSGLQSIIISESRRAAIIDGKTVELGAKHGDARLIEVNEGSVVLRGAQGRQVLTLFPDVKMTSVKITSKQEMKAKPQSPTGKVQSGKQKTKPVAHYEKLLSGHPKEEK